MAIIAGGSVYYFATSLMNQPTNEDVEYEDVVVAVVDIEKNNMVSEDMVMIKAVPVEAVHPNAARAFKEVVGFVTKNDIFSGEQMLSSKIGEIGNEDETLSYTIAPGHRAITVFVDQITGVSGYISPGDYVDVVASIMATQGVDEKDVTKTTMLVENLLVLKTGVDIVADTDTSNGVYEHVTLLCTPEQTVSIHHAAVNGRLTLVLRPVLDDGQVGEIYVKKSQVDPRLEIQPGY